MAICDPWHHLRRLTSARIALGRAGGSLPTAELLAFATDHALARDAVHAELDVERLRQDLDGCGVDIVTVATLATDRATYLKRPDLGRRLDEASAKALRTLRPEAGHDVVLVAADGLSALACQRQVPPLVRALLPMLQSLSMSVAPLVVARQARVAVEDEIGWALGARLAVILLGERPGLGTPDSLGAYLVYAPERGRLDSQRNCLSNIRQAGLPPVAAADTLAYLIREAFARKLSGIGLKDERASPLPPARPIADSRSGRS